MSHHGPNGLKPLSAKTGRRPESVEGGDTNTKPSPPKIGRDTKWAEMLHVFFAHLGLPRSLSTQ